MMEVEYNHLNHATWDCKYHVVFTPKYRKKLLFAKIKRHLGLVFHDLARRRECRIEEGHLMPDHVHMSISIPPKYSVAQIIGYMKGKSSIWIAQNVERKMRNSLGHKFWARGYFVTTIGRDDEMIRAYIRNQELADWELDQFELKISAAPKSNQSSEHPLKPPLAVPNQTSSYAGGYWLIAPVRAFDFSGTLAPRIASKSRTI
jgi:putative transposase